MSNTIDVIDIKYTDVADYKKSSMMLAMPYCDNKCWIELEKKFPGKYPKDICQNYALHSEKIFHASIDQIIELYMKDPLTHAIIFAGFEPLLSQTDLILFIEKFRKVSQDDIVIFTGYNEDEKTYRVFLDHLNAIGATNIIMKFGRYIPDEEPHFDEVLGVKLASSNQYGKKVL